MQYVAHPRLDDPRSNALRELMNAANELEVLQKSYEHLRAFNDDWLDLNADSGCPKSRDPEDNETYDYSELYDKLESHLEKQIAECKAKVDSFYLQVCKLKIRKPRVKKPYGEWECLNKIASEDMPY